MNSRLGKLTQAIKNKTEELNGHAALLYGPPKAGKTHLAGTVASSPDIDTVYWFDNENGTDTLIEMVNSGVLSEEDANKVIIIPIKDTRDSPHGIGTMLKALNSVKNPVFIDLSNGTILPKKPAQVGEEHGVLQFQISKLTLRDCVVIDSLSQLGDSALNATCVGKDHSYKLQLDDYGMAGKWLGDCLTIVQQCEYCNFICVTQETMQPMENGAEKLVPLCGTSKFSIKVPKYFGTTAYVEMHGVKKHIASSASTHSALKCTGSRRNIQLENYKDLTLKYLFSREQPEETKTAAKPKTGGLASRLSQK